MGLTGSAHEKEVGRLSKLSHGELDAVERRVKGMDVDLNHETRMLRDKLLDQNPKGEWPLFKLKW